jgi:ribose transport system substrate-binding protein
MKGLFEMSHIERNPMRKFSRTRLGVAMMMVCVLAISGCKREEAADGGAGGEGKRHIRIGFVAKSLSNEVFQVAERGAREAARELGEKYNANIEIIVRTPNDEDAARQAEAIEALTRQRVDGIAISCTEAQTVTPAINAAVERGIPVICFDSDAAQSRRFAYYGTDDRPAANRLMDELAKAMGEKGTIAILAGNQSAPNLQARVAGVREQLAKYPGMQLSAPNGVFYHVETPEKAAETVQQAQNANAGIQGWAMVGGWPLFTTNALPWPAGSVKVVSWDALPPQLSYIRSGHVEVLLAQDCYGWGAKSVELLLAKILDGSEPEGGRVIDPLTRVTRENVDEYEQNWKKWMGG